MKDGESQCKARAEGTPMHFSNVRVAMLGGPLLRIPIISKDHSNLRSMMQSNKVSLWRRQP